MEPTRNRTKKNKGNTSQGYQWKNWGQQNGGLCSIPKHVINGPDCVALNHATHRMLMSLIAEYNGKNNGDLSAAKSVISKYGFNSADTISRSINELLSHGLIVKTRSGYAGPDGRRLCSLFAVTWLPIDEISDRQGNAWIPKITGTRLPLRTDFSKPYNGEIKYDGM